MARIKGKIVGITSMKGGVGKSVLTLSLAQAFALLDKKVLVVDLDLYGGSIALNLNLKPEKTIYQYVDDISNNRYHDFREYIVTFNNQIDIISCPKDPRQANKIDPKYIEMFLDNAQYRYDVILLDMTHMLSNINIMVLDIASEVVYVMTNDPTDLKNTKSFMTILEDIEKDNVSVVLNNSVNPDLNYFSPFDIKNVIKHKIDYTISKNSHSKNITKYIIDGQIIGIDNRTSVYSKKDMENLSKLAKEILKKDK